MALTTRPTFDSGSWFTEQAAAIDQVMAQLIDVHKQASPTMRVLLNNKKNVDLGPDGKISQNFIHEMYNVSAASQNQRFAAPDIDPASRMEFTTVQFYTSAGTNDVEMKRYRSNHSRIDLIDEKVQAMHAGLTWVLNYALFSDWSETGVGTTSTEIDITSELSNSPVPPSVKFDNLTAHGDRIYSIPMVIRDNNTGHTFGNVSSANAFWQPSITTGGSTTQNTTAYNASSNPQTDVVTNDDLTTATFDLDALRTHLNKVSRGYGYELYAACPADLYDVLEDLLLAERRRDATRETQLADLGIDASFTYTSRNVVFYVDPMMTDLWPGTIWFYDPSVMFLVFDSDFDPTQGTGIYPWERLPGTTQSATAIYADAQLMCVDRRGVSAMHGYAA
jgi:hypothetical protein